MEIWILEIWISCTSPQHRHLMRCILQVFPEKPSRWLGDPVTQRSSAPVVVTESAGNGTWRLHFLLHWTRVGYVTETFPFVKLEETDELGSLPKHHRLWTASSTFWSALSTNEPTHAAGKKVQHRFSGVFSARTTLDWQFPLQNMRVSCRRCSCWNDGVTTSWGHPEPSLRK